MSKIWTFNFLQVRSISKCRVKDILHGILFSIEKIQELSKNAGESNERKFTRESWQ